jgi:hypothetical protein
MLDSSAIHWSLLRSASSKEESQMTKREAAEGRAWRPEHLDVPVGLGRRGMGPLLLDIGGHGGAEAARADLAVMRPTLPRSYVGGDNRE